MKQDFQTLAHEVILQATNIYYLSVVSKQHVSQTALA